MDDIPANGAPGEDGNEDEDGLTVSGAVETGPAPVETWMPSWWQFAAGLLAFGAAALSLAWLGGVIGVVLIMALLAAVMAFVRLGVVGVTPAVAVIGPRWWDDALGARQPAGCRPTAWLPHDLGR